MKVAPEPCQFRIAMFSAVVLPDGVETIIRSKRTPWPDHLGVTREFIDAAAESEYLTQGDGMFRFMLPNGDDALYGFAHFDELNPAWLHLDLIRAGCP